MRDRRPATSRSPRSKARVTKRRRLQWKARGSRSVLPTRGSLFPHSSPSVLRNGVDAIPDCPVGYSQGFPCISGGTFVSVPSPAAQPVVPNEFYVLRYDQAARALFGSLLNAASTRPGSSKLRAKRRSQTVCVTGRAVAKVGAAVSISVALPHRWFIPSGLHRHDVDRPLPALRGVHYPHADEN